MKEKHLKCLKSVYAFDERTVEPNVLLISKKNEYYVEQIIEKEVGWGRKYVVVAPGAADHSKQWTEEGFSFVCDRLVEDYGVEIVFVGNDGERRVAEQIDELMKANTLNLCGHTNLVQLAALFKRCFFVIANDSAPMHLASYLDVPVLALFGPTDPSKYGPWSSCSCFLQKNESCRACAQPKASLNHTCLTEITGEDVFNVLRINILDNTIYFEK